MAEKVSRFLWFQVNWIREKRIDWFLTLLSHIYGCHVVMGYHVGRDIDKSIQFRTKSGGLTIKKKFQLKKLKLFSSNSFLEQKMKSKKFKNSRESEKEKLMMEKNVSSKQKKILGFWKIELSLILKHQKWCPYVKFELVGAYMSTYARAHKS